MHNMKEYKFEFQKLDKVEKRILSHQCLYEEGVSVEDAKKNLIKSIGFDVFHEGGYNQVTIYECGVALIGTEDL